MSDAPITRFTNLVVDASLDNGNPYKIMRCPRINNEEIGAIPADGLKGGEIIFNTNLNAFQAYDGTAWSNLAGDAKLTSYCSIYRLNNSDTNHLDNGDHCPFNETAFVNDPDNLMELSTAAYSTDVGVHSLGRVKLKSGYIYKIDGFATSLGPTAYYGFSLYDVTSDNTRFGTYAGGHASPDQDNNADTILSTGYVNAAEDRIIELRKTGGTLVNWYSGNTNLSECWMNVRVIGKI